MKAAGVILLFLALAVGVYWGAQGETGGWLLAAMVAVILALFWRRLFPRP